MKNVNKFIALFAIYAFLYFTSRIVGFFNSDVLIADINGIGWLYSAFASIYGILAAFTIQSQSRKWDDLTKAIRDEVGSLRRMLWLSTHAHDHKKRIRLAISTYLNHMSRSEWKKIDRGERSVELEESIKNLQEGVYQLCKTSPHLMETASSIMENIVNSRAERIFYSAKRTPVLLMSTLHIGAVMVVFLSNFIGVKNLWLDFLFTCSVALLITLIITVIDDLEHPYRPGAWHVTQKEYNILFTEIQKESHASARIEPKKE